MICVSPAGSGTSACRRCREDCHNDFTQQMAFWSVLPRRCTSERSNLAASGEPSRVYNTSKDGPTARIIEGPVHVQQNVILVTSASVPVFTTWQTYRPCFRHPFQTGGSVGTKEIPAFHAGNCNNELLANSVTGTPLTTYVNK